MRSSTRGMSEYQVRTHLYDPPEMVRRLESKLECWKIASGPRMRGEDLRRAFEQRLDGRSADQAPAEAEHTPGPRIRLIA